MTPGGVNPGGSAPVAIPSPVDREDLRTLLRRLLRMDESSVVRIADPGGGYLRVWSRTPFGALVSRVVVGTMPAGDVVCGADHLLGELDVLPRGDREGRLDPGMPLTSAWHGVLPPDGDFRVLDSVPAQVLLDLEASGKEAARDAGPLGLPPSLLDQTALTVRSRSGDSVGVPMRSVFALTGCGFVPSSDGRAPEDEPVRVSVRGAWVRLDARYGTVHWRPESLPIDPTG